jgi:hypothetical protein
MYNRCNEMGFYKDIDRRGGQGVFADKNGCAVGTIIDTLLEVVAILPLRDADRGSVPSDIKYTWSISDDRNTYFLSHTPKCEKHKLKGKIGSFVNEANNVEELNCIPMSMDLSIHGPRLKLGSLVTAISWLVFKPVNAFSELTGWYGASYERENYEVPDFSDLYDKLSYISTLFYDSKKKKMYIDGDHISL